MAHLIAPHFDHAGTTSVDSYRQRLLLDHDRLAAVARDCVLAVHVLGPVPAWGITVKRTYVQLGDGATHSFAELVNQLATVERILDTLAWIAAREDCARAVVLRCHPTTSSGGSPDGTVHLPDHDLVIGCGTKLLVFEVSDVASEKDGNAKARRDLDTLSAHPPAVPGARDCFLVVSSELARGLLGGAEEKVKYGCLLRVVAVLPAPAGTATGTCILGVTPFGGSC